MDGYSGAVTRFAMPAWTPFDERKGGDMMPSTIKAAFRMGHARKLFHRYLLMVHHGSTPQHAVHYVSTMRP